MLPDVIHVVNVSLSTFPENCLLLHCRLSALLSASSAKYGTYACMTQCCKPLDPGDSHRRLSILNPQYSWQSFSQPKTFPTPISFPKHARHRRNQPLPLHLPHRARVPPRLRRPLPPAIPIHHRAITRMPYFPFKYPCFLVLSIASAIRSHRKSSNPAARHPSTWTPATRKEATISIRRRLRRRARM